MKKYDVIIIGAGAAGLVAARAAVGNGKRVLVLDMGDAPARKVRVSGGGRCNFTNMSVAYNRYFGENPDFVRSACAAVKPTDILNWAHGHGIEWFEKTPGQFFTQNGAGDIVDALMMDARGADMIFNTRITAMEKSNKEFIIHAENSTHIANSVIIATGGISYPNLGVSDFGYMAATKFGHKIIPARPGLVAIKTDMFSPDLAGIAIDVEITIGKHHISDSLLFTHFGIGGPAAYRASLYDLNQDIFINFAPKLDMYKSLLDAKKKYGKKSIRAVLSLYLVARFAKWIAGDENKNIADYKDRDLMQFAQKINKFAIPAGAMKRRGMQNAEVTHGGISTADISSRTMGSRLCPGLFFAGEVLDITGDLGGFNLHWAWASGHIAGKNA